MNAPLRIGALGIGPFWESSQGLLTEARRGVEDLAAQGASLVLLPELFAAPFFAADDPLRWGHLAEPLDGPTGRWASDTATRTGIAIVFGMALSMDGGLPTNAVVLAEPGRAPRLVQRKVHLAPVAGERFGEADHFSPGPPAIGTFDYVGMRFAALVCYDRRFPESWRAAARGGADVVLVLVGGPAADPPGLFEAEVRTHAKANAVYALCAARHGTEHATGKGQRHDGTTLAATPAGALIPAEGERILVDIEPERLRAARTDNPTHRKLRLLEQAVERAYA